MSTLHLEPIAADTGLDDPLADLELDIGRQEVAPSSAPPASADGNGAAARRPRPKGILDRSQVRRVAQKVLEINGAAPDLRSLLARLLGCPDEPVALAVEVTCGNRGAAAVADLQEVASADPMEAGVLVASWERPRSTGLWNVLVDLGALKGNRPPHDAKAALTVARAAHGLSPDDRARLAGVALLLRRA